MADNGKPNNAPLIGAGFIAAVILSIMGFWLSNTQETITDVIGLKPQIASLQNRMEQVEDWQRRWPTQGELSGDIRQNKDIEYLQREVQSLQLRLAEIAAAVQKIKLDRARESKPE